MQCLEFENISTEPQNDKLATKDRKKNDTTGESIFEKNSSLTQKQKPKSSPNDDINDASYVLQSFLFELFFIILRCVVPSGTVVILTCFFCVCFIINCFFNVF